MTSRSIENYKKSDKNVIFTSYHFTRHSVCRFETVKAKQLMIQN